MFNGVSRQVPAGPTHLKYFYDDGAPGTDRTYNHMAVPWTWAFDTPFSWTKQIASHFGGTRQGMCVRLLARAVSRTAGGIRNQFHHVIDAVPTILKPVGIPHPRRVDGIPAGTDRRREFFRYGFTGPMPTRRPATRRSTSR